MIGAVVIGRNEGERLRRALQSLEGARDRIVYVDSGSVDDSPDIAASMRADVLVLDDCAPFTAARARNAGFNRLIEQWPETSHVMFLDGDCAIAAGWLERAGSFLSANSQVAVVVGDLHERRPEANVYNWLCDVEWEGASGEIALCGGNAMIRADAFRNVGGYRTMLFAGEEPELCVRLREAGWRIWRLNTPMADHDANLTQFANWWRRMRRGGRAYAEVSRLHAGSPFGIWGRETLRALAWSLLAPGALLIGVTATPYALGALLAYPTQIGRMAIIRRERLPRRAQSRPWTYAAFMMLAKFAEGLGILDYWTHTISRAVLNRR